MNKYEKSRQLVRIRTNSVNFFIDTPGYLYYYEPFEQHLFVHHKIIFNDEKGNYFMSRSSWAVIEPRTGLLIHPGNFPNTRKKAIGTAAKRLLSISRNSYHEAILIGLADAPERKPRFKFINYKTAAVWVEE